MIPVAAGTISKRVGRSVCETFCCVCRNVDDVLLVYTKSIFQR